MSYLRSFVRFWWDFIVGDDWRVAAGLGIVIALTWLLEDTGISAWWLLPAAVTLLLAESVWRGRTAASRRAGGSFTQREARRPRRQLAAGSEHPSFQALSTRDSCSYPRALIVAGSSASSRPALASSSIQRAPNTRRR
jgi:hypothetical protein